MNTRLGLKSWATGALVLAAVTGCASGNDPAASGPQTPTSPSTATRTTAPPSDSEVASKAASGRVRRFYANLDQLRQHQSAPLSRLKTVATSIELKAQETLIKRERAQGLRQTGDTKTLRLKVQSVNLDNSNPKAGQVPTVQVDVCWDVSDVDVIDKSDNSVVRPDRPDTGWTRYTVANYHWATDPIHGWRVASGQDLKKKPCVAS